MIIHRKLSLPYHAYRTSRQKLLSLIFRVTQGVCSYQIILQYTTHPLSDFFRQSPEINQTSSQRDSMFFMGDNNTQKMMTSNETRLTVAIADIIISEGLSFNLSQKPRFKKVLELARTVYLYS